MNTSPFVLVACNYAAQDLVKNYFEMFLDVIKNSQIGNTFQDLEDKNQFVQEYVNNSEFLKGVKIRDPEYLKTVIFQHFGARSINKCSRY
jgi:hypothetical protein